MLTGSRRFNRGIKRQQIGLESDVIDGRHNASHLLVGLQDKLHGGLGLRSDCGGFFCLLNHLTGHLLGLLRVLSTLAHRGGDLLHARRGLHQRGGLLFGSLGKILITLRHLIAGHRHRLRIALNVSDQRFGNFRRFIKRLI